MALRTSVNMIPAPWGAPRLYKGQHGGAVWHGKKPATQKDIDKLHALAPSGRALIDERTLCGKADPAWTTYYEEMTAKEAERNPWLRFRRWMGW